MTTYKNDPEVSIGFAFHSLRAISSSMLKQVTHTLQKIHPTAPIHIHIAEQIKEVQDCIAWCGERPVEWLLDQIAVNKEWCLVHATHMTETETKRLAHSGAVAGLCPTTEANLGDGFFNLSDYIREDGYWGIGSDSHISVSMIEELRLLEYGQRLLHRERHIAKMHGYSSLGNRRTSVGASMGTGSSVGTAVGIAGVGTSIGASIGASLYRQALTGGAKALGRLTGVIAVGKRADFIVLDPKTPTLLGKQNDTILDAMIFAGNINPIRHVIVGGRHVIKDFRHAEEEKILSAYKKTLNKLLAM